MRTFLTVISAIVLSLLVCTDVHTQQSRVADREAAWSQYVLPQSTFVRQADSSKAVLIRVPSEWSQSAPDKLEFSGPHGATFTVIIESIPDGIPLRDYVAAAMQQLRSVTDALDSIVVRRTTMSGLEAREIMFESSQGGVDLTRRIIWSTVSGPTALSLVLVAPVNNVVEVEPYFKAIVQSVILLDKNDYVGFDALRSALIKDIKPQRIDEIQTLAEALTALDGSNRLSKITRLAAIFASSPDTAIDMVLDSRPMVRAAAFEAIALSRNKSLDEFLLRALNDRDAFVAEKAARTVAGNPKAIELLRSQSFEWNVIGPVARVWPFLSRENQVRILQELFAPVRALATSSRKASGDAQSSRAIPRVTTSTVIQPGSQPPPVIVGRPLTPESNRVLNGLTLLKDLPASDFKLPLMAVLATKNDALVVLALQLGWWRHELLPAAELVRLLSSSNREVRRLAALNLGQSGSVADIKSIEAYFIASETVTGSTPSVAAAQTKQPDLGPSINEALQLTVTKIRFREQLSTASGDARLEIIKTGLADPKLSEWVWYRYINENVVGKQTIVGHAPNTDHPVKVLPLGENIFPKDVAYYAALPRPGAALDKFIGALNSLQLESARSQANLVLILSAWREQMAEQLDSPPGVSPAGYSGVNINEPIAVASWYADGAPAGIRSAEREAIILRVTDRARFERSLTEYQRTVGDFEDLTGYVSGGVRFLTVLPVFLPVGVKTILEEPLATPKEQPLVSYGFVGMTEWNGYSVKVVEQRRIDSTGHMTTDAAYLTYIGDTAVLAPNLDSLRDVLMRAASEKETLAANPDFKQVMENPGEAIYLSNLTKLFANPTDAESPLGKGTISESGVLKISNATWENSYKIRFDQADWLKPFIRFKPETLVSPSVLLPRTTVAYYFMNFDGVAAWRDWSLLLFSADERKSLTAVWAIDFDKEVLPELGPECGVAMLGLPSSLVDNWNPPLVVFFKLKSDKLARALEMGKLFSGGTTNEKVTHVKLKSGDLFVAVKGDFLVLSRTRSAIAALDNNEKLSASRDFSRAAKLAPADVVAFGGYNLEAAVTAIGYSGTDPFDTQRLSLVSSLANGFHSPYFFATAASDAVQARFSLSMGTEGRFSVSELSSLSKEFRLTYAQVETRGVPIQNQERLSSLKIKIRTKSAGEIDRIRQDVSTNFQITEKVSEKELLLKVLPRHAEPKNKIALPVKSLEFAPYLRPTNEIRSDDKSVIEKAKSIAGEERDAWTVARKLADWTYTNIKWKRVDDATAPQTLATLEADCAEFSQLYVAMARSLGLPARIVSGLAFAGTSFGGHAWVEVYVGEWVEVDPTWGTDFVDATHIRDSGEAALLTYAALNLVDFEVLEAPRAVAEFQKSPRALAEILCKELPKGSQSALASALDLSILANEKPSLGSWESLTGTERDAMSAVYHRLLMEVSQSFREESNDTSPLRLLKVTESGDRAQALAIDPGEDETLLKLEFVRSNDAWYLIEILQADTDLYLIAEVLYPTKKSLLDRRIDKSAKAQGSSEYLRGFYMMQKDPGGAVVFADAALKNDPTNRSLQYMRAFALLLSEKKEDAIQAFKDLAEKASPFAPALFVLAGQFEYAEKEEDRKMAIEFYSRYGELEPDDPRWHVGLAGLYERLGDDLRAEAEHRAALKSDPLKLSQYVDFSVFMAARKRFDEAISLIDEVEKKSGDKDDRFGDVIMQLYFIDDNSIPEELARRQPHRMEKSAAANLYLGLLRVNDDKSLLAIPLLKKAASLEKEWSAPHIGMARAYRTLRNWTAALAAADAAIERDAENGDGYYQRACALTRLGRLAEALKSLEKAVELDSDYVDVIEDEPDLKALASRPAFKKLLIVEEPKK